MNVSLPSIIIVVGKDEILDGLRSSAELLKSLDRRRAEICWDRDLAVAAARDSGASWAEIMEASGLSRRSVSVILKRVSEG